MGVRAGSPRQGAWLAGFYFNAAIERIAAAAERLGATEKGTSALDTPMPLGLVKHDVNVVKHERGGVLTESRWAHALQDAVEALEEVTARAKG